MRHLHVRPLLRIGTPVLVDGHPICETCGRALEPVGVDRWRHVPDGRTLAVRPRWRAPITWRALRRVRTYEEFKGRFPWAVRPGLRGPFVTSEDQWREGRNRLAQYQARLEGVRRERSIRAGENPYLDLVRVLAAPPLGPPDEMFDIGDVPGHPREWGLPYGLSQMLDLRERRRELAALFSWAIPTSEALDTLARHTPLVEGCAGMGYWVALLRARGVDVVAYDLRPPGGPRRNEYHRRGRRPWTEIHHGSSVEAARRHPDRTLFLCWPPYADDTASHAALQAYRGDVILYVGEPGEGATGSVRFQRELRLNWTVVEDIEIPRWPRLRDRLMVYRRNPARRPHVERDRCPECRRFIRTGSAGRCDCCFDRRPPAVALRLGTHRIEYPREALDAMPAALRRALEESPNRIRGTA
jgi:hypothetical protein